MYNHMLQHVLHQQHTVAYYCVLKSLRDSLVSQHLKLQRLCAFLPITHNFKIKVSLIGTCSALKRLCDSLLKYKMLLSFTRHRFESISTISLWQIQMCLIHFRFPASCNSQLCSNEGFVCLFALVMSMQSCLHYTALMCNKSQEFSFWVSDSLLIW